MFNPYAGENRKRINLVESLGYKAIYIGYDSAVALLVCVFRTSSRQCIDLGNRIRNRVQTIARVPVMLFDFYLNMATCVRRLYGSFKKTRPVTYVNGDGQMLAVASFVHRKRIVIARKNRLDGNRLASSSDDTSERSLMTAAQKNRVVFTAGAVGTHEYHLRVFAVVLNTLDDVQLSVDCERDGRGRRMG